MHTTGNQKPFKKNPFFKLQNYNFLLFPLVPDFFFSFFPFFFLSFFLSYPSLFLKNENSVMIIIAGENDFWPFIISAREQEGKSVPLEAPQRGWKRICITRSNNWQIKRPLPASRFSRGESRQSPRAWSNCVTTGINTRAISGTAHSRSGGRGGDLDAANFPGADEIRQRLQSNYLSSSRSPYIKTGVVNSPRDPAEF